MSFHAFSDVLALTVFYTAALVLPLLASSVVKEVKTQEGDKVHLKKMETSKWVAIFSAAAMITLVVVTQNAQIKLFILITVVGSFYLNIAALYDWANYRPYIEKRLATYFPSQK